MKKTFLLLICLLVCCTAAIAQSVTLTFTAKDVANHYVQLNRVSITNLTKGWQETIYWPDTTLTMQNGTGINDVETFPETSLKLSQNNPNPFTGTTEVSLTVAEDDEVMLDIADVNGKIVGTHRMRTQAGIHQFRVTLATSGTYVMTARQNGQSSSIKMVCNVGGDGNRIEYTGIVGANNHSPLQTKSDSRGTTNNPFNFGDQMEYVGYATINGTEAESQRIMQAQGASQTFTLQFTQTQHQLPTVTTSAVSNITSSSATAGGTVISDGGATVFDRGVCYSTASMPTVSDNCIHIGQGTGTFSDNITGLNDNTTYYVRAYAMSNAGIAYGNEVSFSTTSTAAITVTTDPVTNIGSHSVTCGGTVIYAGEENIMVRGVCWNTSPNPTANHSHTTDGNGVGHFTSQLTDLNPGTTYYVRAYATSVLGTVYGNEVEFTTSPLSLPTVFTYDVNNFSYNSAYCGGYVTEVGDTALTALGVCWSTTQNPTIADSHTVDGWNHGYFYGGYIYGLNPGTTYYVRVYATNSIGTAYGNEVTFTTLTTLPTVITASVSNIMANAATCGGNVTDDGGATVTARGVCWSTSLNPTITDSHTTNGNGTGSFTSNIAGLTSATTYYVRAYATNSIGTAYGEVLTFTTPNPNDGLPCSGAATVTDYDDNTYNTVQIGAQCWMKENLRTTHYSNGTSIALGSSTSTTTAYRYYPNNSSANVSSYGYLYNWKAVMRSSSPSSANPSGVQGICPTGWHVPSDVEWTQLTDYVGSQTQYQCDNSSDYFAKALASTTGWTSYSTTCAVGNNPSTNNATGFSALPAGYSSVLYDFFGSGAYFWSATENDDYYAYFRSLTCYYAGVYRYDADKYIGCSVRCVLD